METKKPEEQLSRTSFDALLAGLDDGGVVAKVDEDLVTLMRKTLEVARSKGQAGTAVGILNLKITFKVESSGEVEIRAGHTATAPTLPRALNRRWIDPKTAAIVDSNPKQMGLPLNDALPISDLRSV